MKQISSLSQLLETVSDLSARTIIEVAADGRSTVIQEGDTLALSTGVMKPAPDREQVEKLKRDWKRDSWDFDLEDTEGFEAYRDELKAFRIECERQCTERYERQKAAERQDASERAGIPADHPAIDYVLTLEGRLKRIEERLGEVEERIDWRRS